MSDEVLQFGDDQPGVSAHDLRDQVSMLLVGHLDDILSDAVTLFPFSGSDAFDARYCRRVGQLLIDLLAYAVRDVTLDGRSRPVIELHAAAAERGLTFDRLFAFAYLVERTALDELALDETIGATSESWALVAQMVRRASFDLLAAYSGRVAREPGEAAITDPLTTLYTRPMFDAVLAKELERAGRLGETVTVMLFDVDGLRAINEQHGYGVGDRILERLGIMLRQYFRLHDWVARHEDDSIAVLLTGTGGDASLELAERVRAAVAARLGSRDHRTDEPVDVTVSAAVVNMNIRIGDLIDRERLFSELDAALTRAKSRGNSVERVDLKPQPSQIPPHTSPSV